MAAATLRFDPEVAARAAAASCAESALTRGIFAQAKLPRQIGVNVVGAIQASLSHVAATWPSLSVPQKKRLAIRYDSHLRKGVGGAWSATRQSRPLGWHDALALAQRPSFEVALAVARVRLLASLCNAPAALIGFFASCLC